MLKVPCSRCARFEATEIPGCTEKARIPSPAQRRSSSTANRRMLLAQRALRDGDVRVGSLAASLGYASEGAFSTAFKREVGESPLRYRNRIREEQP
jgi:hypothetical protein